MDKKEIDTIIKNKITNKEIEYLYPAIERTPLSINSINAIEYIGRIIDRFAYLEYKTEVYLPSWLITRIFIGKNSEITNKFMKGESNTNIFNLIFKIYFTERIASEEISYIYICQKTILNGECYYLKIKSMKEPGKSQNITL